MTNRERLTELRYQMEKNSFILSIIEARISVIWHAEEMGYSITDTAIITRTSTHYVSFVMALKDKYSEQIAPNGLKASSIEDLAQIVYDRIYVEDHKYAGHFSRFDTELLDQWFELKKKQEALFDGIIDRQQTQAVFQDAYFQKFGEKVSIREIEEKTEHKQQETEPEEEVEQESEMTDEEMLRAFREQMTREEVLVRMFRENAISEAICRKYMDAENLSAEAFLKIVEMHKVDDETEPDVEIDVESWFETQKKEHQMELLVKLGRAGGVHLQTAFKVMNESGDFRDYDEFLRILDIWTEKEEKSHE